MKKHIVYAISALIGFHLRWIVSAYNGWNYSMTGADIIVALACIAMAWSFRGLLPQKEERRTNSALQQSDDRQSGQ